jgi:hypothetical protein
MPEKATNGFNDLLDLGSYVLMCRYMPRDDHVQDSVGYAEIQYIGTSAM